MGGEENAVEVVGTLKLFDCCSFAWREVGLKRTVSVESWHCDRCIGVLHSMAINMGFTIVNEVADGG